VKDIAGVAGFLILFALIVFYAPEMGGFFLEHPNFEPADPLKTPEHIAPVWYFTPYYAILRAVTIDIGPLDSKVLGVMAMGAATVIFFALPWLDRSPVKSIRYRVPLFKGALAIFVICFFILGYLGTQPATPGRTLVAQVCSVLYFLFFLLMPIYTKIDKTKPVPERVTFK
jgi:ubiquinol-cytochrome c reductase cytochrome b subunit